MSQELSSKLRRHKLMERAIRSLMGAGVPPRFKFKDTYSSVEFPTGYTVPAQATLEAKFAELEAEEEDLAPKTKIQGDFEIGTANVFVDVETGRVGIGTDSPSYLLDVHGTSNVGALTATTVTANKRYLSGGGSQPYQDSMKNSSALSVGWYRIAENGNASDGDNNGTRCSARFTIIDYKSGQHSTRTFYVGGTFGSKPFIHLLTNTSYGSSDGIISKVRVVEDSTYEGLAVEIYVDYACNASEIRVVMDDNYQTTGFGLVSFESVVADHSGMNEYEIDLNTTSWGAFIDTPSTNICMLESGNVGIGKTNPSNKLDVVGDIYATGNITGYSDKRAKSDIQKIENALEKLEQINGYTFTMNDKRYTGVIAQEVLPVLPEAVTGSEETHYAVAYGNMMGLIIEAIKELKEKIG